MKLTASPQNFSAIIMTFFKTRICGTRIVPGWIEERRRREEDGSARNKSRLPD